MLLRLTWRPSKNFLDKKFDQKPTISAAPSLQTFWIKSLIKNQLYRLGPLSKLFG
jgi:hypothetical protein